MSKLQNTTTTQSGNSAHGDIVGGNKSVTVYSQAPSLISVLNERFKAEEASLDAFKGFIGELQHYWDRATNPDVRGLAAKLKDSNRQDLEALAERLKENATKKIVKYQTSHSAQEILVWAFGDIYSRFILEVTPNIEAGSPRSVIDSLINEKVIDPVVNGLGENVLHLYRDEIVGLVFFLAGNCHLKWDKN